MFAPDIVSLRQFYATRMGGVVRRRILARIEELWPPARGDFMLGVGFCAPYFEAYPGKIPAAICMPAQQGAAYWPVGGACRVFLAQEGQLPLRDASINRVLLMHSLETSEQLSDMLDEVWRVLTPGGRVLAVAANRHGFWSRSSRSPFGYGRPFSMAQLRDLMERHDFTPLRQSSALFLPPLRPRLPLLAGAFIEILGRMFCPFFGGVVILEAEKQIYAAVRQPAALRKTSIAALPAGVRPVMGRQ